MAFNLNNFGEGYVYIRSDDKDLEKGLKKARTSLTSFGKFAAGALAGLGAATFLDLGKRMVLMASDAEEMNSKLQAVWLKNADEARRWSDSLGETLRRSKWEVRKFHTELGDLFQPMGFTAEEAMKLSKQVTQLTYDLASFNNISDSEALERLRGTLVGSHENALKFGVVINEAALKTELLAMGAKKVNGEFTTQQKVTARLNLLLAGTKAAHGDAARTASGFAGQLKALSGQLEEVGTELGQELVGPLKEALNLTKQILDRWKKIKHGPGDVGKPSEAISGEAFLDPKNVQSILNLPTAGERITGLADRQQEAFKMREQAKAALKKTTAEKDANINAAWYDYDPVKDYKLSKEESRLRELVKQLDTEIKSVGIVMKSQMKEANAPDSLEKPVSLLTDGLNMLANAGAKVNETLDEMEKEANKAATPLEKLKELWQSDWGGEEESVAKRNQLKKWREELGDLRTPMEKFNDEMKKLDALKDAKFITPEQYASQVESLKAMLEAGQPVEKKKLPEVAQPNMAGQFGGLTDAWKKAQSALLKKQEETPEKQLKEQILTNKKLDVVAERIEKIGGVHNMLA